MASRKFPYPIDINGSVKGFCGIKQLMVDQEKTLKMFRKCSEQKDWKVMHSSHYDWWMFPIDEHASTMNKYVLSPMDAERIRTDPNLLLKFREGVDQEKTLKMFRKCSEQKDWKVMHSSHYDWWMFPIDEHASTMNKYVLSPMDAERIRTDPNLLLKFREGVELLMAGWGWDVRTNSLIESPATSKGQKFTGYAVRLWKAGRCMQVLQQDDYFKSLLTFARLAQKDGHSLRFSSSNKKSAECISLWLDNPIYKPDEV
eukprot:TRINITY_DN6090_c0_g2_i1.p1 TRINITY_DN6090_c0_g2~~TRINITY_DN6090_c0_g2_i1.p1  ORF type:complete len:257 (+),score=41.30 TRINITY_DN6090_c0_g2_i1:45-815(+)